MGKESPFHIDLLTTIILKISLNENEIYSSFNYKPHISVYEVGNL